MLGRTLIIYGAILLASQSAIAGLGSYLKGYNVGVDYATTTDKAQVSYDIDKSHYDNRKHCSPSSENGKDNVNRCRVSITTGRYSGWGLFLQQPFQRQGNLHFNYDIGFRLSALEGSLDPENETEYDRDGPVKRMNVHLYGMSVRPYVTIGLTPKDYPDLLFSFGPTAQLLWGTVRLNDYKGKTGLAGAARRSRVLSFTFGELEVVFLRFGRAGAFSFAMSWENSKGTISRSDLFPEEQDKMTNFELETQRNFFGFKLLTNLP